MAKRRTAKLKQGQKTIPTSAVTLHRPQWDMGASGPANRHGLRIEDAPTIDPLTGEASNPNQVQRARRVDMLEVWAKAGTISTAGYTVACNLRNAFEATQRSPGAAENDRVDSSPKPDHAVTIQIDRLSAFQAIMRHVSAQDRAIVDTCVLSGRTPGQMRGKDGKYPYRNAAYQSGLEHLAAALDRLARKMEQGR